MAKADNPKAGPGLLNSCLEVIEVRSSRKQNRIPNWVLILEVMENHKPQQKWSGKRGVRNRRPNRARQVVSHRCNQSSNRAKHRIPQRARATYIPQADKHGELPLGVRVCRQMLLLRCHGAVRYEGNPTYNPYVCSVSTTYRSS